MYVAMCSAKLTMTFRAASAARSKTGWISSADYLLNKHVGIGVNAGIIYGNVYDEDGVIPNSMDQSVEFYRIFINSGLHFYF